MRMIFSLEQSIFSGLEWGLDWLLKILNSLEFQTEANRAPTRAQKSCFVIDWKTFSSLFATNSIEITIAVYYFLLGKIKLLNNFNYFF